LNLGPHAFETGTVITWATLPALFVLGIFKIGSHTLFAQGKLMCNVFLFLNIESSSYILDKSLLFYIYGFIKLPLVCGLHFTIITYIFESKEWIILMKSNL
jgi:hypothetical protein